LLAAAIITPLPLSRCFAAAFRLFAEDCFSPLLMIIAFRRRDEPPGYFARHYYCASHFVSFSQFSSPLFSPAFRQTHDYFRLITPPRYFRRWLSPHFRR